MSASAISSSNFSQWENVLASAEKISSDFQQLGSDLQSGNSSAAEQDYLTLSQDALSSPFASSSATSSTPASSIATSSSTSAAPSTGGTQSQPSALEEAFQTLGQDLQAGNLSGAQQAYAQIQQGLQSSGGERSHHHHHGSGGSSSNNSALQALQAIISNLGSSSSNSSSSASSTGTATAASASNTASMGLNVTA